MNQIEWLEQNLDKVKKRLLTARQNLKDNPTSYSAKVAMQSAERGIADLQNDLRIERKKNGSHLYGCSNAVL